MKTAIAISLTAALVFSATALFAGQKKVQSFTLSKVLNLPADQVWKVVAEDYGAIAKSHPKIIASDYINGSLRAEEGAERICKFNDKGTKFLKESMMDYDPENMTFKNQLHHAGKFPMDSEKTNALYKVEDLGNGTSRITFTMNYRTKPAFMGMMARGQFKNLIRDYFIAIEHHAKTGETVTKENFKKIKKMYS